MESIFLATSIAAVTEFVKRIYDKDARGALIIVLAAVIGLLAGITHVEGLTVATGLLNALGIVGIHTIAKQIG